MIGFGFREAPWWVWVLILAGLACIKGPEIVVGAQSLRQLVMSCDQSCSVPTE